ncbi:YwqG family protein [Tengunoibacter tsumagoiensis]|uniref:DUF1963 domain-containing protein n=1 Tax=Tengunoibacter tsumagoiensis TaxID=2014871 RepID=A0A401ZVW2_9CHLR|nr:YwqG family protein [Tengunoibacter tsumagoiensis]GCE11035.1 hypothetical protein KTT_08940 [Tengunoibacter tsumagoiensis]
MDNLSTLFQERGLARVSQNLQCVALPSIRLKAQRSDDAVIPCGATKFGGGPDLAAGQEWPERQGKPLPFLAQLDLAALIPYDMHHVLPRTGRLSFFFDVDAYYDGDGEPRSSTWKVCYDTTPLSLVTRHAIPTTVSKRRRYDACTITPSFEWTLPGYEPYSPTRLQRLNISHDLPPDEEKAYYTLQNDLAGLGNSPYHIAIHRCLGNPDELQHDPFPDLGGTPSDWVLLLQMDSDGEPETQWADTGRLYFWCQKSDLAAGDLSQVQMILDC